MQNAKSNSNVILFQLTKGDLTRQRIIEATITSISKYGFEGTSVSTIAKIGKVNRGSIVQHFSTTKNLFNEAVKAVFANGRAHTEKFMDDQLDIEESLEKYIRATYAWFKLHPKHAQFMTLLFTRSAYDPQINKVVDGLVANATNKMTKYIEDGIRSGAYNKKANAPLVAITLYTHLMGSFLLTLSDRATIQQRLDENIALYKNLLK